MSNSDIIRAGLAEKPVFFLHIPKTAGSSINRLFESAWGNESTLTHIESKPVFGHNSLSGDITGIRFLSGHHAYPYAGRNLDLKNWTTACTLRQPNEHIISHIAWVRLLGEPGHEARLQQHVPSIRKIVDHLREIDLSSPSQLTDLIKWLEQHELYLFHNTQTRYLCGGKAGAEIPPPLLQLAYKHLDAIDLVGTVERIDEYLLMLIGLFGLEVGAEAMERQNSNNERFGLDISNKDICHALEPLIACDNILYEQARKRFIETFHAFLVDLERGRFPCFTTTNVPGLKQALLNRPDRA